MNETTSESIYISNREKLTLEGIKDILTFNDENLILETLSGNINIKGSNLQVSKFDTDSGTLEAGGTVQSVLYNDRLSRKAGLAARLFK